MAKGKDSTKEAAKTLDLTDSDSGTDTTTSDVSEESEPHGPQSPKPSVADDSSDPPLIPFTQTGRDDAAPVPNEEAAEDIPAEQVTLESIAKYSDGEVTQVHVSFLRWDRKQEWGQIRPLNDDRVTKYLQQITMNEPRTPVRVLLRSLGSGLFVHADSA